MYSLAPNTLIESAKLQENFDDLADGSGDTVENSLELFRRLATSPFVASGGVITGDAYGSTRAASMTALVAIINGKYVTKSAVTARLYTASKDTYVDVDQTGTITYTEVTNGANSPSLATNSIRLGKVVTGASNIAASSSIKQANQGDTTRKFYNTDTLGNKCYPTNPDGSLRFSYIENDYTQTHSGSGVISTSSWTFIVGPQGAWLDMSARVSFSLGASPAIGAAMSWLLDGTTKFGSDTSESQGNIYYNASEVHDLSIEGQIFLTPGTHTIALYKRFSGNGYFLLPQIKYTLNQGN